MTNEANISIIVVHSHPTEQDYAHARASHRVWALLRQKTGGRSLLFSILWMAFFGALGAIPILGNFANIKDGRINLAWVVALATFYPLLCLLLTFQIWLNSGDSPASGIIEQTIPSNGRVRVRRKFYWLSVLIVFAIGYLMITALNWTRTVRSFSGAGPAAIVVDDNDAALPHLQGGLIFCTSLFAAFLAILFFNRINKRTMATRTRQARLLLPRTWEFTEEHLIEHGEFLESKMKWEYIRKFLETPRIIMLYPNDSQFYLVPKNAFASDEQFGRFMSLVMRKIPNGITQPHVGRGFTVRPLPVESLTPPPLPQQEHGT